MKHPNILATVIAIEPFYIPPPAYGEAETIVVPPPDEAIAPAVGALAGDVEPDWGHLEEKYAEGRPPETIQAKDPTAISPETPAAPVDPAKATPEPEKAPESPDKAAVVPPVTEAKPAEAAKVPFDPDAAAKKLEEIQISPKASESTKEGFRAVKAILGPAITENKSLKAQIAELKAQVGKPAPEVEKELAELREFKSTWGPEHDPGFIKPYTERIGKTDEAFVATLLSPDIGMPKTDAEAKALNGGLFADPEKTIPISEETLKRVGIDSPQGQKIVARVLAVLRGHDNPLLYEQTMDNIRARKSILAERDAKIEEVRGKQGGYIKAQEEKADAERAQFAGAFNQKMIATVKDVPWLAKKPIAPDATPEAKALAEKHNAYVEKEFVEEIRTKLAAAYHRDPEATAEMVFKAVAHDQVAKERDALAEEKKQLEARVAELTKTAQGVRQVAAAPAKANGAPITPGKEPAKFNQTAEEAVEAYLEQTRK